MKNILTVDIIAAQVYSVVVDMKIPYCIFSLIQSGGGT